MADDEQGGTGRVEPDRRKQSLYFPQWMLVEMRREAARLDRSLSWVVQRAWKAARNELRRMPGVNDADQPERE